MKSKRKYTVLMWIFFVVAISLTISGTLLTFIGPYLLKNLLKSNFVLTPGSRIYNLWRTPPFTVFIDFYFFNWTNPEDIYNKSVKPKFEQVGPYRFFETQSKTDIVWNKNGTITFRRLKFWKYRDEEGNNNLQDNITTINPIALSSAHVSRTWSYMVRKGLSLTLSHIAPDLNITRTVNEMLFEGYPDTLINVANTFPFFAGRELPPWKKFAWFYARNGSSDFEGVFTMGTGKNSTFGKLYKWNHWTKTPYFDGKCGEVDGFLGDFFEPCEDKTSIGLFSSDVCRKVVLEYAGKSKVGDVIGNKYVAGDYMFDNGTLYPENKCFCGGECLPSGVFNVSSCRYGSPSFASLPHFYKADSYYRNLIEGMQPDDEKHDFFVVIEPTSGIPLEICGRLQLNLLLQPIPGISMYENVPRAFFPMLWFEQKFQIPDKETAFLKLVLKIPFICFSLGIFVTVLGLTLLIYIFHQRCSGSSLLDKKDQHLYQHECVALNSDHKESVKEN